MDTFTSCNLSLIRLDSFSRGNVPSNELQIYTWYKIYSVLHFIFILYRMDCTLRELMSLIKEVNPDTRQKGTLFSFATVYPDNRRSVFTLHYVTFK